MNSFAQTATERGQRVCRRITRHHAKTFYFASHFLPRHLRRHAYAVYGFCRWADNGVDDAADLDDARRRVQHARDVLDLTYRNDQHAPPGVLAFRQTVRQCQIPRHLFDALLDGMEMDLTLNRYPDFPSLDLYCYRVAGVVGLMMTHVFGYRHERCFPHAVALGRAMQLTNILRDVKEDLDRGRLYLPQDELARFGVTQAQLATSKVDHNFRALMQFQVDRARQNYTQALQGIPDLATFSGRLTVRVMGRLYSGILDSIESLDYNIFSTRAHLTTSDKIRRLHTCLRDELSHRAKNPA